MRGGATAVTGGACEIAKGRWGGSGQQGASLRHPCLAASRRQAAPTTLGSQVPSGCLAAACRSADAVRAVWLVRRWQRRQRDPQRFEGGQRNGQRARRGSSRCRSQLQRARAGRRRRKQPLQLSGCILGRRLQHGATHLPGQQLFEAQAALGGAAGGQRCLRTRVGHGWPQRGGSRLLLPAASRGGWRMLPATSCRGRLLPAADGRGWWLPGVDQGGRVLPAADGQGLWLPGADWGCWLAAGTLHGCCHRCWRCRHRC